MIFKVVVCAIVGYVFGCFNAAYYYAKLKGNNIFTLGSANAGATNVARCYGLRAGIAVGLLDGLKMILPLVLVHELFSSSDLLLGITIVSCVAGHIFPFQLGFCGGKGASCLLAAGLYLLPWIVAAKLAVLFLILWLTLRNYKKAAFGTMLCSLPVLWFYMSVTLWICWVVAVWLVVYSHQPKKIKFKVAKNSDEFDQIARLNYQTFVEEIPQHATNQKHSLTDKMHDKNRYIIAKKGGQVIGMVALNEKRPFSLDQKIPNLDDYIPPHYTRLCEVRLLSIKSQFRKGKILAGLIKAICKYVLKNDVECLLISGTTRELKMYRSFGFKSFYQLVGKEGAWYQPMMLEITPEETDKWNH
ncbi:MAG: glycerol-3-phosphate acyltransferase [Elusimicrobiaceae bacterium]|nr:glycerol-3-phosphate acyltransferase [Elusimicrobiaceae bacterium]